MSDIFVDWYDQLVDVETLIGGPGAWGSQTTVTNTNVPCRVRSSDAVIVSNGSEIRAKTVLDAGISDLSKFTPGSTVTLPDGRDAVVLSVDSEISDPELAGITVQLA